MPAKEQGEARATYQAYLDGHLTPEEAAKRVAAWYAARYGGRASAPPDPDTKDE